MHVVNEPIVQTSVGANQDFPWKIMGIHLTLKIDHYNCPQSWRLKPFVGEPGFKATTYLMATTRMYFPFLTCEVKRGAAALDVADRQNAQSMSVAPRGLVVLFRYVKREKELDREIFTFSISHDHRSVRIYGHYPVDCL